MKTRRILNFIGFLVCLSANIYIFLDDKTNTLTKSAALFLLFCFSFIALIHEKYDKQEKLVSKNKTANTNNNISIKKLEKEKHLKSNEHESKSIKENTKTIKEKQIKKPLNDDAGFIERFKYYYKG